MTEKNNLELWQRVEKTDPDYTKRVKKSGHVFTAIDAYYQIKKATEVWGLYGKAWGLKDSELTFKDIDDKTTIVIYKVTFYYPEGEFEIRNSMLVKYYVSSGGYVKTDEEFAKKIETDTITKALSRLGFNADVFLGKFDDSRYVEELKKEKEHQDNGKNNIPKENQWTLKRKQSFIDNTIKALKRRGVPDSEIDKIFKMVCVMHGYKYPEEVNNPEDATKIYKSALTVKVEDKKEDKKNA